MYLNKVMLIGNLTRDPELKSIPSGMKVTNFSVATNRVWRDKDGSKKEATEFHNVVVFGRQAETVAQYMKKGSNIMVEGRLQTRMWEADGKKNYRTEIIADNVQFGSRGGAPTEGGSRTSSNDAGSQSSQQPPQLDTIEYPDEDDINPDDIPF
ncbi:MAG: single-strand DNA-binding protein [Patescibacteria group bacterium]|nr:single-strand DNA-binding protein [Patescibacteria group bacterium]